MFFFFKKEKDKKEMGQEFKTLYYLKLPQTSLTALPFAYEKAFELASKKGEEKLEEKDEKRA